MTTITISREYGSHGERIGKQIARNLGYSYFDKEILRDVAQMARTSEEDIEIYDEINRHGLSEILKKLFVLQPVLLAELPYLYPPTLPYDYTVEKTEMKPGLNPETVDAFFMKVVETLWNRNFVVIIGRGSQKILEAKAHTLHIRVVGAIQDRIQSVMVTDALTHSEAERKILTIDKSRAQYLKNHHGITWNDPKLYHLVVNTSFVPEEHAVKTITTLVQQVEQSV